MCPIKFLIVEDEEDQVQICKDTLERYMDEHSCDIELVVAKTVEEALENVSSAFDGGIIDLKLGVEGYQGNDVVNTILQKYRIPLAVLTGNPANSSFDTNIVPVYIRGDTRFDEIFDFLLETYGTGLTKIFGGRGVIENCMDTIFWKNLIPQLDSWRTHVSKGKDTEKALLRFVLYHMIELMNDDSCASFPEEMYITPPIPNTNTNYFKTGSIVGDSSSGNKYIVLSPACDLALHDGNIKTNRILFCLIENHDLDQLKKAKKYLKLEILPTDDEKVKENKTDKIKRAKKMIDSLPRNNYSDYFHYLPPTSAFEGGIIDFRKVSTCRPTDFTKRFPSCICQISTPFVKDIVARFSSYYSRQGQPDFDFVSLSSRLMEEE